MLSHRLLLLLCSKKNKKEGSSIRPNVEDADKQGKGHMFGKGLAVSQREVAALALLQPDGESSAERPGQVQELHQIGAGVI